MINSIQRRKEFEEKKLNVLLIDKKGKKRKIDSYDVTEVTTAKEYGTYRLGLDFKVRGKEGDIIEYTKLQIKSDFYDIGSIRVEICDQGKNLEISFWNPITFSEFDEEYEIGLTNKKKNKVEIVALEYNLDCEKEKKIVKFRKMKKSGKEVIFQFKEEFKIDNIIFTLKWILKVNGKEECIYSSFATVFDVNLSKDDIITYLEGKK